MGSDDRNRPTGHRQGVDSSGFEGPRRRRRLALPIALLTTLALAVGIGAGVASAGASSASSSSNIEGVWAFENGQIAIHPSAGGTFTGTVVVATNFAECVHPVEQSIWTGMTLQPDGSYWGFHQKKRKPHNKLKLSKEKK